MFSLLPSTGEMSDSTIKESLPSCIFHSSEISKEEWNATTCSCAPGNEEYATGKTSRTGLIPSRQPQQEKYKDAADCLQRKKLRRKAMSSVIGCALSGGFVGGFVWFVLFVALDSLQHPEWSHILNATTGSSASFPAAPFVWTCPNKALRRQRLFPFEDGIRAYLSLFEGRRHGKQQVDGGQLFAASNRQRHRKLDKNQAETINPDPTLVIAGKMNVEGGPCNVAQYDLKTNEWSLTQRIQLSLYNSYSGGEVYSLLPNLTSNIADRSGADDDNSKKKQFQTGSGDLIVVGAFDTTFRNSQTQYCSVGKWDGLHLSKVGEGLCYNAFSNGGLKITTAALAGINDVYVAGSFQTKVWNGDRHEFVKIFNIAHFNAVEQVWSPLNVGQITCSWCTVAVLALAWDSKRRQLHVAGKFNAIDGHNVPAGLAIYDFDSGRLVAHPGGGLSMKNLTQDGVGTALQLDEESGVLYVMGSFERLTATYQVCLGLAAYEIDTNRWTCLANAAHTVLPTGGGNMLLTPYGLMVAGKTTPWTTWPDSERPYTIALLKATLKTHKRKYEDENEEIVVEEQKYHDFNWSWLPGFRGHDEPLHALSNGFGSFEGTVFIAGDDLVAKWSFQPRSYSDKEKGKDTDTEDDATTIDKSQSSSPSSSAHQNRRLLTRVLVPPSNSPPLVPTTEILSEGKVQGAVMAISQMMPDQTDEDEVASASSRINITIIVYCISAGCIIGVIGAILCNRNLSSAVFPFIRGREADFTGFSLDTLTYSALENTNIMEAYHRAMQTRYVQHPHLLLAMIDPQEIFLQKIIGEGTFGRVWSAKWCSASVAVKEFVFAQAAVAGKSSMQQEIVEQIIGEAGMMAMLRHPNVLQLFGCSLTAQAIWIVSELCSLGSLRQLLDDKERVLSLDLRLNLALQVAEGMTHLHNQDPPIIHRDLKSHNIFVHETFTAAAEANTIKNSWDQEWKRRGHSKSKSSSASKSSKHETNNSLREHRQSNNASASSTGFASKLFHQPSYEKIETESTIIAKIGDWGSARATLSGSRTMTHGVGTACWLAPEVIKHARSSKLSDVYGYGIVLWELATREEVYQGLKTTQIISEVANESLRPPVPEDCPWKDIMVQCWAENPHDRPEFREIVQQLNELWERCSTSQDQATENAQGDEDEVDGHKRGEEALNGEKIVVLPTTTDSPKANK